MIMQVCKRKPAGCFELNQLKTAALHGAYKELGGSKNSPPKC